MHLISIGEVSDQLDSLAFLPLMEHVCACEDLNFVRFNTHRLLTNAA